LTEGPLPEGRNGTEGPVIARDGFLRTAR
jgi:hypothetical protein